MKFWNFGHITIWHILPSARFFLLKNHSTLIFTIIFIAYPLIGRNRSQNSYCSGTNFRGLISQRSWALNCEILELGPYSIQKFDTTHKSSIFLSKKSLGFLLLQHGLLSSWELYLLGWPSHRRGPLMRPYNCFCLVVEALPYPAIPQFLPPK